MMGHRQDEQAALFYEFSLERHVPADHLVRSIDRFVELDDPEQHAPCGSQLKQWLFGGQSVSTKVGLFPVADYPGQIVSDLFGEDSYFADADLLWQKQNEAIATKRDAHRSGLERVADANVSEKTKAQKQIIRDCLAGANGRAKVEGWLPALLRDRGDHDRQITAFAPSASAKGGAG